MPSLAELARKFHCDKIERHNYIGFYEHHLTKRSIRNLLEIGIGYESMMKPFVEEFVPQCSLKMWRDFFPHATIYGIDNQPECMAYDEERIITILCDERATISMRLLGEQLGPFNAIIHDGSHEIEDQIATFHTMWPYVERGGIFCVEDVRDPKRLAEEMGGRIFSGGQTPDDFIVWKEAL